MIQAKNDKNDFDSDYFEVEIIKKKNNDENCGMFLSNLLISCQLHDTDLSLS